MHCRSAQDAEGQVASIHPLQTQLKRQRILRPQCSIAIKNGNPIRFGNKLIILGTSHRFKEFHKRSSSIPIIPEIQCKLLR